MSGGVDGGADGTEVRSVMGEDQGLPNDECNRDLTSTEIPASHCDSLASQGGISVARKIGLIIERGDGR